MDMNHGSKVIFNFSNYETGHFLFFSQTMISFLELKKINLWASVEICAVMSDFLV